MGSPFLSGFKGKYLNRHAGGLQPPLVRGHLFRRVPFIASPMTDQPAGMCLNMSVSNSGGMSPPNAITPRTGCFKIRSATKCHGYTLRESAQNQRISCGPFFRDGLNDIRCVGNAVGNRKLNRLLAPSQKCALEEI
jgi:hypothetical protein